jgi:hypothetical protein
MLFAAVHESASGTKRTLRVALHMSAFGGKADMPIALHMSAFDPKADIPSPFPSAGLSRYDALS